MDVFFFGFFEQQNEGYRFQLTATATDNGTTPQSASVAVVVRVASAEIKPPSFVGDAAQNPAPLSLAENWVPRITPDGRVSCFPHLFTFTGFLS